VRIGGQARPSVLVCFALGGLFLLGAWLRLIDLGNVHSRSPDERVYTRQAIAIRTDGVGGVRRLVKADLNDAELFQYPPPTRIGYTALIASTMRLTGLEDERAGTCLSCLASILSLAVLAGIGLRFLDAGVTVLALFFLAVFPAELVVARRCWNDSLSGLVGAILLYSTLEVSAGCRRRIAIFSLAAAGSISVLIKETSVLFYVPCLLWSLGILMKDGDKRTAWTLLIAASLGAAFDFGLLAYCCGGLGIPFAILIRQAQGNATSPYPLRYMSGPGYLLASAFEALSPLTVNLAALGAFLALCSCFQTRVGDMLPRLRGARPLRALLILSLVFASFFVLIPHWLNLRYLSPIYVPLCLFAGAGLWGLLEAARRRLNVYVFVLVRAVAAICVVFSAMADYGQFQRAFVKAGADDLSIGVISAALRPR